MKNQAIFRITTRETALIALFAAITAVFSQISIPTPPVPFSLGLLGVMLTATVLDTKLAVSAQFIYILLGAAGVPIFAGFQGGLHRLIGPTGGFLAAYIFMAAVIGMILSKSPKYSFKWAFVANAASLVPCYLLGAAWLGFSMNLSLKDTLLSAVLPFIPFDLVKACIAAAVGQRLRLALKTASIG